MSVVLTLCLPSFADPRPAARFPPAARLFPPPPVFAGRAPPAFFLAAFAGFVAFPRFVVFAPAPDARRPESRCFGPRPEAGLFRVVFFLAMVLSR